MGWPEQHDLSHCGREDGFKVRLLFFPGDDADFNLFETRLFQPAVKVAFRETQPSVAIQLMRLLEIVFHQI
jgi:hypothetical protein